MRWVKNATFAIINLNYHYQLSYIKQDNGYQKIRIIQLHLGEL